VLNSWQLEIMKKEILKNIEKQKTIALMFFVYSLSNNTKQQWMMKINSNYSEFDGFLNILYQKLKKTNTIT
jgi:predicted N-acyltransferase